MTADQCSKFLFELQIKISLKESRRFEIPTGPSSQSHCVCGEKSASQKFYIIPKKLGRIRISVDVSYSIDGFSQIGMFNMDFSKLP